MTDRLFVTVTCAEAFWREIPMSSSYSVINELYGVEPARQEPRSHGVLGLVIVMFLGGMVLYESIHPVMRLRSEPPPTLLKSRKTLKAAATQIQDPIAQSYWSTAAEYVAEKYPFGETLPTRPPEGFTLAMGADYATSNLYWQRLRGLWDQPDMWVRSYQLDTGWVNTALESLGGTVRSYLSN
jgi:hypothetical protein